MTAARPELATSWDDDRDDAFFAITAELFRPTFTFGSSVLLASYDDDCGSAVRSPSGTVELPTSGVSSAASSIRSGSLN